MQDIHSYWSGFIKGLRQHMAMSQTELAEALGTTQTTVSRWEHGYNLPAYRIRTRLKDLAVESSFLSMEEVVDFINVSPFCLCLLDQEGRVVTSSATCRFQQGRPLLEQVEARERKLFQSFLTRATQQGLWTNGHVNGETGMRASENGTRVVATPITLHSQRYGLLQICRG